LAQALSACTVFLLASYQQDRKTSPTHLSSMAPKAKPAAASTATKPDAKPKAKAEKKQDVVRPEDLIPKVPQPDEKEFEARIDVVNQAIEKIQKEQQALSAKISERSGGKDEFTAKRAELREQLDDWSRKMDAVKAQKDELSKQIGEQRMKGLDEKNQLNKMKKSIGYTNETDIDERIATIEFKLWTESIPLREEKQLLAEISVLKKKRPQVAKVKELETNIGADDRGVGLKESVKSLNEQMASLFGNKKKVAEQLKELNEARTASLGDLPDLIQAREKLSNEVRNLIAERNAIKAERRQAEQEYYAYQAEIRKIRQERAAEERNKRQKEYEERRKLREAEKMDEQPYVAEITLIEQTILFCKGLTQPKGSVKVEDKKETTYDNPDNTMVLLKKEDREEYFFAPTAKGKKSKSKAKADASDGCAKPIKHNAETFQLFDKLKLDAPITTHDIPALLEKLELQLEDYQQKVREWEVKRDDLKRRILDGEDVDFAAEAGQTEEKNEDNAEADEKVEAKEKVKVADDQKEAEGED